MEFAKFMSSATGRTIRIVAGLALIYVGIFVMQNTGGYILAAVGFAPLVAGIFDFCIFAPLFGGLFLGKDVRK